ncbi:MAG: hypothetical protein ABSH46_21285 [Bryobacteraceae bacterium]
MRPLPLLLLALGVCCEHAMAQKVQAFDPEAYPSETFRVTEGRFLLGDVTVRIVQARKTTYDTSPPSACRAWFEVRKQGRLLKRLYYDDIEALGGWYGIFVPKKQPLPDYFVAVKQGDYDGRLLLVARDGSLADLPGGAFFVTPDKRFIVGEHSMDTDVLAVADVARRRIVIDGERSREIPQVAEWYQDASGYFYTEGEDWYPGGMPPERKGYVYRLDLMDRRVVKTRMSPASLAEARRVAYESLGEENCTVPTPPSPTPH